jgi:hypothetical protein
VHFNLHGANNSKSLFAIPKFDLHADKQFLKVGNEQKSLGYTVGHGQTIQICIICGEGQTQHTPALKNLFHIPR